MFFSLADYQNHSHFASLRALISSPEYCFQGMNQKPIKNVLLGEESCEITSLPVIFKKKTIIKKHHVLTLFDLLCVLVEHDR